MMTIDGLRCQGSELDSQRPLFSRAPVFHPAPWRGVYHPILPRGALLAYEYSSEHAPGSPRPCTQTRDDGEVRKIRGAAKSCGNDASHYHRGSKDPRRGEPPESEAHCRV